MMSNLANYLTNSDISTLDGNDCSVLATFAFRIPVFLVIPNTSFIDLRAKYLNILTLVKRDALLMSGTKNINAV